MNGDDFDDKLWSEIGRIVMYEDDWSVVTDPVALEMACLDILEVELERGGCGDAVRMLAGIGIKA